MVIVFAYQQKYVTFGILRYTLRAPIFCMFDYKLGLVSTGRLIKNPAKRWYLTFSCHEVHYNTVKTRQGVIHITSATRCTAQLTNPALILSFSNKTWIQPSRDFKRVYRHHYFKWISVKLAAEHLHTFMKGWQAGNASGAESMRRHTGYWSRGSYYSGWF